jgi:hypothetical protein
MVDKQYNGSVYIEQTNSTLYLAPRAVLDNPKGSKEYYAHEDENIFVVANRFYQDTSYWYPICSFSGVVDPFNIPEGTKLLLPIYETKSPKDTFI